MLQLPPEFDLAIYTANNRDLAGLAENERLAHYKALGMAEGRVCSRIDRRTAFIELVPCGVPMLEIGPYTAPAFSRPAYNVRYLDAFTTDELKVKAAESDLNPHSVPEIDFVWSGQSYAELVREQLQVIYSSHNIEHQPDLVRHLQQIGYILEPGGAVLLTVPDRRYCFDHFLPDTTFADVLSAYYDRRIKHAAGNVLEHRLMTTHNEVVQHWNGNHGAPLLAPPVSDATVALIAEIRAKIEVTAGYIDTHAWQFTPSSFRFLIETLKSSHLIELAVERIYTTVRNSNEFYVVLIKS